MEVPVLVSENVTIIENSTISPIDELHTEYSSFLPSVSGIYNEASEYSSFLPSASAICDEASKPKFATSPSKNLAYAHDGGNSQAILDSDGPMKCGIAVSVHGLHARVRNRAFCPRPK